MKLLILTALIFSSFMLISSGPAESDHTEDNEEHITGNLNGRNGEAQNSQDGVHLSADAVRQETTSNNSQSNDTEWREEFDEFDKNHDGMITLDELREFMSSLGVKHIDEELKIMIGNLDKDGNGSIDLNEYVQWMSMIQGNNDDVTDGEGTENTEEIEPNGIGEVKINDTEWREIFKVFDRNHDGKLTADELGDVMNFLGVEHNDEKLKNMINNVAKEGNDYIDDSEFVQFMSMFKGNNNKEEMYRNAFRALDKDQDGVIKTSQLIDLMNNLGLNVTDGEAIEITEEIDPNGTGELKIDDFVKLLKDA